MVARWVETAAPVNRNYERSIHASQRTDMQSGLSIDANAEAADENKSNRTSS